MTSEIKERIAAINSGIVPEGYKKTKVGIVPVEWEIKTLGQVLKKVSNAVDVEPDTQYQEIGIRSHGKGIFYKEKVSGKKLGNKSVFWIEPDCFVLNIVFAWEQAIGRTTQKEIGMIASHRFPMFKPNGIDLDYLVYFLLTKKGTTILELASPGGAGRNKTLGQDKFLNSKVILPPLPEQQKIAEILSTQDKLIALQEKKIEQLNKLKKAYLQKMFPKKGSNYPELRFQGFTDAWEQRKLSEISEKVSKKNQDMVVDEVFTNSAEFGIISQRDYFDKDIANSENIDGYYIVEPNDFVYNPRISTLAPFGPVRRNKLDKSGAMSPLYYVFRAHNVDCGYLEYFFKTNRWHSFMHLNGNSGARSDRFAIRDEVFRDMPISMPQDIVEQKKVGDFFSTLELAITLHQRKLEQEKQKKKALMQLLLTGKVRVKP